MWSATRFHPRAFAFLIYINDLSHASTKIFSILFADDSNLFLSGRDPDQLIRTMNEELVHIVKWLQVNKVSVNLKKPTEI